MSKTMQKQLNNNKQPKKPKSNFGLGKNVSIPLAVGRSNTNIGPRYSSLMSNGDVSITHREWIGNVNSSINFTSSNNIPIQPCSVIAFPWLSAIAANYEKYEFVSLTFEYVPRCSTSIQGFYYQVVDYDALDHPPNTELQVSQYSGGVEDVYWRPTKLVVPPARLKGERFTRVGVPPNSDLKTYDVGNYYYATTDGIANNLVTGKLFVEYTIKLKIPQQSLLSTTGYGDLYNTGSSTAVGQQFLSNTAVSVTSTTTGGIGLLVGPTTIYMTGLLFGQTYMLCMANFGTSLTYLGNLAILSGAVTTSTESSYPGAMSTNSTTCNGGMIRFVVTNVNGTVTYAVTAASGTNTITSTFVQCFLVISPATP